MVKKCEKQGTFVNLSFKGDLAHNATKTFT